MGAFVARMFWAPVGGLAALPLFMAVDAMGMGQRMEDLALIAGQALGWSAVEGIVRRSWKALAIAMPAAGACVVVLILDRHIRLALVVMAAGLLGAAALAYGMHLAEQLGSRFATEALRITGGNRTQAARLLKIKRTTLVEKLARLETPAAKKRPPSKKKSRARRKPAGPRGLLGNVKNRK